MKSEPTFSDIIPTRDGVLELIPTVELRWFIELPVSTKPRVLQQLWRDRETGAPYWRDVPTSMGKRDA